MFLDFSLNQIVLTALIFIWTGFVRAGLGFGGAALGLPLLLFVNSDPLYWLPMIGVHLLFFSALTLWNRLDDIDWRYLLLSSLFIVPAAIAGIFGLLNFPTAWMLIFIYTVTLTYGFLWLINVQIRSNNPWLDRALLISGGYVAGTTLSGAPLIVAVFARNVSPDRLRNTLFVLWFLLVSVKMSAFIALEVPIHFLQSLALIPVAAIGHIYGQRVHQRIVQQDYLFKRVMGGGLFLLSIMGLIHFVDF